MKALTGALMLAIAASAAASAPASASTSAPASDQTSGDAGIAPFIAHYEAAWKGISLGTSDIQLTRGTEPGHYLYTWTITARGIFRIAYSDDLVQKSWLSMTGDHARPDKYFGKQGSSTVEFAFDWQNQRATGVSETKPVDIKLPDGTQCECSPRSDDGFRCTAPVSGRHCCRCRPTCA